MRMRRIVTCGLPGYKIFLIFLSTAQISNKNLLKGKCVLIFSTNLSEKFLIPGREQDRIKNLYLSSRKVLFSPRQILNELEF
jgi:hypothetical protein